MPKKIMTSCITWLVTRVPRVLFCGKGPSWWKFTRYDVALAVLFQVGKVATDLLKISIIIRICLYLTLQFGRSTMYSVRPSIYLPVHSYRLVVGTDHTIVNTIFHIPITSWPPTLILSLDVPGHRGIGGCHSSTSPHKTQGLSGPTDPFPHTSETWSTYSWNLKALAKPPVLSHWKQMFTNVRFLF